MESHVFDLQRAFDEAQLPEDVVASILAEVEADFPNHGNLYELHVVRAIQAEQAARMTPEAWLEGLHQRSQTLLAAHHLEQAPVPEVRYQIRTVETP